MFFFWLRGRKKRVRGFVTKKLKKKGRKVFPISSSDRRKKKEERAKSAWPFLLLALVHFFQFFVGSKLRPLFVV